MHKTTFIIIIIAGLVAVGVAGYLSLYKRDLPMPELSSGDTRETLIYASDKYGLRFEYSPGYYLKERDAGSGSRPQLAVALVEDTQENRDVLEGRATVAREGPTAITIDVYSNQDELPAEDWVRADTNWTIRTSEAAPIGRGSVTGVTYSWSGLYEGKSVVVTEGDRAYVFSVTWLTPEDPILAEFDRVLSSVTIAGH